MAVGIKIGANTSEFNKSMMQVTNDLQRVASECLLAGERAELFGTKTDQLASQQKLLATTIEGTQQKISLYASKITQINGDTDKLKQRQSELKSELERTNQAYQTSVNATGKSSAESKKLANEISNLEKEYSKNEKAIASNDTQLTKAVTNMNKLETAVLKDSKALETVKKELSSTATEEKKLAETTGLTKFSSGIDGAVNKISGLKTAFLGITATLAGGFGLFKFTEGAIKAGDNAYVLSQKLHLSTTEATGLNKILSLTDTEMKPLITTIMNLDKSIGKAGDTENKETEKAKKSIEVNNEKIRTLEKSKKITDETREKINKLKETNEELTGKIKENESVVGDNAKTLEKYGIKLTDASGKLLPVNAQLEKLSEAYKKSAEAGQEEAFVADVLGAKGANLVPLLENYTEAKEQASKIKGFGINPKEAHETEMQLKQLKMQVSATGGVFAKSLVPVVQAILPPLITIFQNLAIKLKENKEQVDKVVSVLIDAGKGIGSTLLPVLQGIFNLIVSHGTASKAVIEGLGVAFVGLKTVQGTISGVNGVVKTFKDMKTFGSGGIDVVKRIGGAFVNCGKDAKTVAKSLVDVTKSLADTAWTTSVDSVKKVGSALKDGAVEAGKFALNLAKGTIELAKQGIEAGITVVKLVAHKVATIASSIANGILTASQAMLNFVMSLNPITLIVIGLTALVGALVLAYNKCDWFRNMVNDVWNSIKSVFADFNSWLQGVFSTDWSQQFGAFGEIMNGFMANASNIWNSVKEIFNGIIDFVSGVFTGNWSGAWDGIKEIFSGVFDGLYAIAVSPLNQIIGLVNTAIDSINSFSFDMPSVLGGGHIGFNISNVPYLATGGIIDSPTLAMVGEAGQEAVVPLEKGNSLDILANKLLNKMPNGQSNSQPVYVIVNVDNHMDSKQLTDTLTTKVTKAINRNANNRRVM